MCLDFERIIIPEAILGKIEFCLRYSRDHNLLPVFLGDVFHLPRDNSNWLLTKIFELVTTYCTSPPLTIYGNHDCHGNALDANDSLSVIRKSEKVILLDEKNTWKSKMGNRTIVIGGSSWGETLPTSFPLRREAKQSPKYVVWLTHHDIRFPAYPSGVIDPHEIPGIDIVINGHIHRTLEERQVGNTKWMNPGSISRISRSDATRERTPSLLKIDCMQPEPTTEFIPIPHQSFDDVFFKNLETLSLDSSSSAFVEGLAELQNREGAGVGIREFLEQNMENMEKPIRDEIQLLAEEVLQNAT